MQPNEWLGALPLRSCVQNDWEHTCNWPPERIRTWRWYMGRVSCIPLVSITTYSPKPNTKQKLMIMPYMHQLYDHKHYLTLSCTETLKVIFKKGLMIYRIVFSNFCIQTIKKYYCEIINISEHHFYKPSASSRMKMLKIRLISCQNKSLFTHSFLHYWNVRHLCGVLRYSYCTDNINFLVENWYACSWYE